MFKLFAVISVIFLFVLMQNVSARTYCLDNKTIIIETNTTYFMDNETLHVFDNETSSCEYMCQNDSCVMPKSDLYAVILLIVVSLIIFIVIFTRYLW
jgi:hypothetical protein